MVRSVPKSDDATWVEKADRQVMRPILTMCALLGLLLGGLQIWIAGHFVSKDEMAALREQLKGSHHDHVDDYQRIEAGLERLNQTLEGGRGRGR